MEAIPLLREMRVAVGDAEAGELSDTPLQSQFASVTPKKGWSRYSQAIAVAATIATLACAAVVMKNIASDIHPTPTTAAVHSLGVGAVTSGPTGAIHRGEVPVVTLDAADLGKKDKADPDTVITVGFLSSGDFFWLPMVKLLEAALPGVTIRLTDPTYNWRALGLEEAKGLKNVVVTSGPVEPDLVLEGPDIFKTVCFWEQLPWVQTTAEPTMFFNTWNWCERKDNPAFLRLDTGLGHYKQPTVYDENVTSFVWSPYAMTQIAFNEHMLQSRTEAFSKTPQSGRPFLAGWVSANGQEHRSKFFNALVKAADGNPETKGTVHAMGGCDHNHDWSDSEANPPRHLKGNEIYKDYRWVLALENVAEPGYLTEKLVNAQASGAVPVYYGDSRAARKVFKKDSFVDAFEEWSKLGVTPQSPPSDEDWDKLAQRIVEIDRDPELYNKYTGHESVLQDYPELEEYGVSEDGSSSFEKTVQYPNEPFPLLNRLLSDQTDEGSGTTGEAMRKIRAMFPEVFEKLTGGAAKEENVAEIGEAHNQNGLPGALGRMLTL